MRKINWFRKLLQLIPILCAVSNGWVCAAVNEGIVDSFAAGSYKYGKVPQTYYGSGSAANAAIRWPTYLVNGSNSLSILNGDVTRDSNTGLLRTFVYELPKTFWANSATSPLDTTYRIAGNFVGKVTRTEEFSLRKTKGITVSLFEMAANGTLTNSTMAIRLFTSPRSMSVAGNVNGTSYTGALTYGPLPFTQVFVADTQSLPTSLPLTGTVLGATKNMVYFDTKGLSSGWFAINQLPSATAFLIVEKVPE